MLAISVPENVSDIPTEIHVFESISHKIPVMVGTVKGFWEVTGHEITMIDPEKPKPE